jgi:hypothetical protein
MTQLIECVKYAGIRNQGNWAGMYLLTMDLTKSGIAYNVMRKEIGVNMFTHLFTWTFCTYIVYLFLSA